MKHFPIRGILLSFLCLFGAIVGPQFGGSEYDAIPFAFLSGAWAAAAFIAFLLWRRGIS
jgi:hypothetical protein